MKNHLTRILSLVLVFALLADPALSAVAGAMNAAPAHASLQTLQFQEDALAERALDAVRGIPPLHRFFSRLLGRTPQTPVPENAAGDTQVLTLHRPGALVLRIVSWFGWVPVLGNTVIEWVQRYQDLYDGVSAQSAHQLTETLRASRQYRAYKITHVIVEIFPNEKTPKSMQAFKETENYTPVLQVFWDKDPAKRRLLIKEAAFVDQEPEVLALLLGYGHSLLWLKDHPRFAAALIWIIALFRLGPADARLDMAAKLFNVLPFSFYWRLRPQMGPFLETPPITLQQILSAAHLSPKDQKLMDQAYRFSGWSHRGSDGLDILYPSRLSQFVYATSMARDVAELGLGAVAIAAALLSDLDATQLDSPDAAFPGEPCPELTEALPEIQGLIAAFDQMQFSETFRAQNHVPPRTADYRVQRFTDRFLEVSDKFAHMHKVPVESLRGLFLSHVAEHAATFDLENEREDIEEFYFAVRQIYSPLAERLIGHGRIPRQIDDSALKAYNPKAYAETEQELRDHMGLEHYQAQAELARIEKHTLNALRLYGIPDEDIQSERREKSGSHARYKKDEDRQGQIRNGEVPTKEIKDQRDPMAWRIVVRKVAELQAIRHSLVEYIGGIETVIHALTETVKVFRGEKGDVAIHRINFTYANPYKPGHRIPGELQMTTPEGRRILISGRSAVRYEYAMPHWQYKAKQNIDNDTGAVLSEKDGFFYGQQFDHMDPLLQGDFKQDPQAIYAKLKDSINPRFTLDPQAMDHVTHHDLQSIDWEIPVKLPATAVVGDLVFHKNVGGQPDHYWKPYRITTEPDPDHPGRFLVHRKALSLTDRLLPGDDIAFDVNQKSDFPPSRRPALYHQLATAKAQLTLRPLMLDMRPLTRENRAAGRAILERDYGRFSDPIIRDAALPAFLQWQGLTEDELYDAIFLGNTNESTPPLAQVHANFAYWYNEHFVRFKYFDPVRIGQAYEIIVDIDEDQIGLLGDIARVIYEHGWNALEDGSLPPSANFVKKLRLVIQPGADTSAEEEAGALGLLLLDLRNLRRLRGERRPVEDGERVSIHLAFTESAMQRHGSVYALTQKLSELGISIEAEQPDVNRQTGKPDWRFMTLTVTSPSTFKKDKTQPFTEVLRDALADSQDLIEKDMLDIVPAPCTPATIAEIRSFLISEGMQVPTKFRRDLPFNPKNKTEMRRFTAKAEGKVDDLAVLRFKRMWQLMRFVHPEKDNNSFKQQLRDNGAPYWVHILWIVWELTTEENVTDFPTILAAVGHDFFESDVQTHLDRQAAETLITERIADILPPYLAAPTLQSMHELTRKPDESYADYMSRLLKYAHQRSVLIKGPDQHHNLRDPNPKRIYRTIRYYLDFIRLEKFDSYDEHLRMRKDLWARIASLIAGLSRLDPQMFFEQSEQTPDVRTKVMRDILFSMENFLEWFSHPTTQATFAPPDGASELHIMAALRNLEILKRRIYAQLTETALPKRPPSDEPTRIHAGIPLTLASGVITPSLIPFLLAVSQWIPYTLLALPWISAVARTLTAYHFSRNTAPFLRSA